MKIVTVDQMREIEAESDAGGLSYARMMENAGRSAAEAIIERLDVADRRVLILVGPGNNGGDGLVVGRHLTEAGASVVCYLLKRRDPDEDDPFRRVKERGAHLMLADDDEEWQKLAHCAEQADVIVDALLGTGTHLPLRGKLAEMVEVVKEAIDRRQNQESSHTPRMTLVPRQKTDATEEVPFVVAIDGPTGLEYDSGALDKRALSAHLTITFAYPKQGHFRFPGAAALGELVIADIGTDPALASEIDLEVVTPTMVRHWLPWRPLDAHKGTFGKALIVAGSVNYTGAAYLTGAASTRAGAGLVTLGIPGSIHAAIAAKLSEATYLLLPQTMGVINAGAIEVLREEASSYDALLIGPGLGQEEETVTFIKTLFGTPASRRAMGFASASEEAAEPIDPSSIPPLIIDADGLNILAQLEDWSDRLPVNSILTPHPGEMARLMGAEIKDVQADRLETASSQAAEWDQVIVLKGAHTVVAAPDGRTVVEPFATPALATAGTGDVLAGTITALRAQGLDAFEAAAAGAYLHGLAGELAQETFGIAGTVASDVVAKLPGAWERLNRENP